MDHRISRFLRLASMVLISFLLAACPLVTEYPLTTKTDIRINPKLLGFWATSIEGIDIVVKIYPFNNTEYYMEWIEANKELVRMGAYITNIDNVSFLNIHSAEEQNKDFMLLKFTFPSDNTVNIVLIDEFLFKDSPTSSNELYNVVRKNLYNQNLYFKGYIDLQRFDKPKKND